ncbi:hypothetical protein QFC20_004876 [Naganishia adeliensis]|uniref:Uncharacterized protein n=1 Tax=Naganishia adeliensis TaxID=92952 RepID=A0ACC2VTZ4_9TREE|nr:hypothetical protein QFC20_004876 [Naganishia adeliensis]
MLGALNSALLRLKIHANYPIVSFFVWSSLRLFEWEEKGGEEDWKEMVAVAWQAVISGELQLIGALERLRMDVTRRRYMVSRRFWRGLVNDRQAAQGRLFKSNDKFFIHMVRMSRRQFKMILEHLFDHPVFQNASNNAQEPVEWQIFVALTRLGPDGKGSAILFMTNTFSISGKL